MADKAEDFKVDHLLYAAKAMGEIVEERSTNVKKMTCRLDKGESGVDSATMFFGFDRKPLYFNYEVLGYLHRKNRLDFSIKLANYNAFKF